MLASFRRLSKSTVGSIVMVLFVLAILASFALADISNVGSGTIGLGGSSSLAEAGFSGRRSCAPGAPTVIACSS